MTGKIWDDPDKVLDGSEKLAAATATDNYGPLVSSVATYLRTLAQILTNKTIALGSNTISGTTAQFNAALSDNDFATLAGTEELTGKTLNAPVAKGTWTVSGTWTIPAVTLGGTVSGGGNQINNVIIGAVTPLAGSFTTVDAPVHKSAAAIDFQTNGTTYAGNVTTGQQWYFGGTKQAPQTGPVFTVSKNATALPAIGTPAGVAGTAQAVAAFAAADATPTDVHLMSFGTGKAAAIRYFQADGTAGSRTATTSGSLSANFAYGYTGSVYVAAAGFIMQATETYSGSVSGCRMDIYATPTGTTGIAIGASVGAGLMVGDQVDPGAGNISATGSIKSKSATAGIGYAIGAGGAVTQLTSRTTGVTVNKICGAITLVSAAGSATFASFTVTNSAVAATDVVHVCQKSGTDLYEIHVTNVGAGSFQISFRTTGGTTTEQPVFNFAVIKAVAS